jgi:hypothetical protein
MLNKTQSSARLLTAAGLLGIGGIVGWWWLQQPTTVSMDSNHIVAVSEPANPSATTKPALKPSPTTAKLTEPTTTAVAEDYFEQALALHKLALAGDAASQQALGNILELCAPVAYDRVALQNYLQVIYAYSDQLPTGLLPKLAQIMQGCTHFHPENMSLFFPETALFQGQPLSAMQVIDSLPLLWKAMAAAGGNEQALINIIQPLASPPHAVNIDDPQVITVLKRQLETGNPELIWKMGQCLPDEQHSLRVALLEMASEHKGFDPMTFFMFRVHASTLHATSQFNRPDSMKMLEEGLSTFDLPQIIHLLKGAESFVAMPQPQLQKNMQDPTFRAGLIEQCAAKMRQSKPSS